MSESAAAPVVPKCRRRWLRFGLRTFLVVVALAGAGLGWKVREVHRQRTAVAWVRAMGGIVDYDFEHEGELERFPRPIPNAAPPGPTWLPADLRADYFGSPIVVLLQLDDITDVSPLAALPSLQFVGLSTSEIKDVAPLSRLHALRDLQLRYTKVADLAPLARLTSLVRLDLAYTPAADVTPLANLTKLELLYLNSTHVEDLAPLARLKSLRTLFVGDTPVSDESVAELQRALPRLIIQY